MKFPNFKKYFFSYTSIILSFIYYYLEYYSGFSTFPEGDDIPIGQTREYYYLIAFLFLILSFFSILLLGLEILIRKYIIEKYFPKLKITLNFKFPEIVSRVYSFIFAVLFILTTVPVLFIGIYFLLIYIIDILS